MVQNELRHFSIRTTERTNTRNYSVSVYPLTTEGFEQMDRSEHNAKPERSGKKLGSAVYKDFVDLVVCERRESGS